MVKSLEKVDITLPIIIYQGEEESIPDIFDRMNRGSARLSKYEHYSATSHNYRLENVESVSWLNIFYGLHYASDYLVRMGGEDPGKRKITGPFDLLLSFSNFLSNNIYIDQIGFRLSKELDSSRIHLEKDNLKNLELRKIQSDDTVKKYYSKDELGFEIISLVFGYSVTQINKVLNNELLENGTISIEKTKLLSNIIEEIDKIIGYVGEKDLFSSSDNLNYLSYFTVVGLFKTKFAIDLEKSLLIERDTSDKIIVELEKSILNIKKINELEWFRGENRQVAFLTDKLNQVEDIIEGKSSIDCFYQIVT